MTNSGPAPVTNLAVWNGSTWSAVGGGVNGGVLALAFNGPDLYAGGYFTQAGTTPANSIAQWDGANWSPLGTGVGGFIAESVAVLNGDICVAGNFTNADGSDQPHRGHHKSHHLDPGPDQQRRPLQFHRFEFRRLPHQILSRRSHPIIRFPLSPPFPLPILCPCRSA